MINMNDTMISSISKSLISLRKEKNITQTQIANFLNVKRTTYTNWEIGRTEISVDNVNKIAVFYEVNIDYILGLDDFKKCTYDDNLDYKVLANNLNKFLKSSNLKIESLALDAETTISTIWAYLHNKVKIRTLYLYRICKNNNLSTDELFERV